MKNQGNDNHFDVVIMGGGIGGSFQARHLMLKVPGITVAVVEPQSLDQLAKIAKIGESTVEIAGHFMVKELGLGAYLTEQHLPKNGLNFHWAKEVGETTSMEDYWSLWALKQPSGHAWQIHRGRIEVDLMKMNAEMGVKIFEGTVTDFDVSDGDDNNAVHIEETNGTKRTLTCTHVVDAAGRAFLTGRKFKNILRRPQDRYGIKSGTAWVRVKGVNRDLFHDEFDREDTATVRYYGTNHFFGHGHWLWMIPLSREEMEISIGVMHHHDVIPAKSMNSQEKFLAFLEKNHGVLHKLITNAEEVDFVYWGAPSHVAKQIFSSDNWSALGDAIYFGDALYSVGISALCVTIECTTEIIRAKVAAEADAEKKREAYNRYIAWFATTNAHTYRYHPQVLGDASIMSWRIYFEYMWWFGALVPSYVGKWHLETDYIDEQIDNCPREIHNDIYEELNKLAESGVNLGFMDCYRADQLPGAKDFYPDKAHVPYMENAQYGRREVNIYTSVAATHHRAAQWWMKLQRRAYGVRCYVRPKTISVYWRLMAQAAKIRLRAAIHEREIRAEQPNRRFAQLQKGFQAYSAPKQVMDWMEGLPPEPKKEAPSVTVLRAPKSSPVNRPAGPTP